MRRLIVVSLILAGLLSIAWTDWTCVRDCMRLGYTYSFCKRACGY